MESLLLYSMENKYFVFAIYITSILFLLYRIPRNKDLAIWDSNSILRVEQICNMRRQSAIKKWKEIMKIWNDQNKKNNVCLGESEMMKKTRECSIRQERLLAHIT